MRTPTIASAFYAPDIPPNDAAEMQRFLYSELLKIQSAIAALSLGHLDKTHVSPVKPRDGDIRFADGTNWNPGAGQGIYARYGGTWNKL